MGGQQGGGILISDKITAMHVGFHWEAVGFQLKCWFSLLDVITDHSQPISNGRGHILKGDRFYWHQYEYAHVVYRFFLSCWHYYDHLWFFLCSGTRIGEEEGNIL